jgi:hypothetical protein
MQFNTNTLVTSIDRLDDRVSIVVTKLTANMLNIVMACATALMDRLGHHAGIGYVGCQ